MGFSAAYDQESGIFTISFNDKVIEKYEDAETWNASLKFHNEYYKNIDKYYEDHWTTDIMDTMSGFQYSEPPQPYHVHFEAYVRKSMEHLIEEFERNRKQYAETVHYKEFSTGIQNLRDSGKVFSKVVVVGVGSLHRAAYVKGDRWMPPTMVYDILDAILVATTLGECDKRLPLYFQDPCYSKLDKKFLTTYIGAEVVDDPDAFSLTNDSTILLNLDPVYKYMGQWIADGIWPSAVIGYDWVAQDADYREIPAAHEKKETKESVTEKPNELGENKSTEQSQEIPGNVDIIDSSDIIDYHTEELDTMFAKYKRVPLWDEYPISPDDSKTGRSGRGRYISLWVRTQDLDSEGNILRGKGKANAEIAVAEWFEHVNKLGPGWRKRREQEYVKMRKDNEKNSENKSDVEEDLKE
ncbi:hypothetical protein GLAREA_00804 [Glarea lozoyensis ATCC 20868]|uniref:SRR1-like domain-containing protein n=1 Tax=Glarea lozoyensis (strain ATCC 20868 / MF5171) TaxID=1116229 RepID=S3CXI3_GLAL2|nr:uncharacterized protein GLAREA_00804 [Glarea lozoyensis ATCC 20868]EPE29644.1 hypothetical protein GLAREA_00804 [Glarea lozoyensis ATCC 20868]